MKRTFVTLPLLVIGFLLAFVQCSKSQDNAERYLLLPVNDLFLGKGMEGVSVVAAGSISNEPAVWVQKLKSQGPVSLSKIFYRNNTTAVVFGTGGRTKPIYHTFVLQGEPPPKNTGAVYWRWKVKVWHFGTE